VCVCGCPIPKGCEFRMRYIAAFDNFNYYLYVRSNTEKKNVVVPLKTVCYSYYKKKIYKSYLTADDDTSNSRCRRCRLTCFLRDPGNNCICNTLHKSLFAVTSTTRCKVMMIIIIIGNYMRSSSAVENQFRRVVLEGIICFTPRESP